MVVEVLSNPISEVAQGDGLMHRASSEIGESAHGTSCTGVPIGIVVSLLAEKSAAPQSRKRVERIERVGRRCQDSKGISRVHDFIEPA